MSRWVLVGVIGWIVCDADIWEGVCYGTIYQTEAQCERIIAHDASKECSAVNEKD